MQAAILSIGDELTLGQTVDTNAAWLSAQLATHGVPTRYHHTVPDDQSAIARAIRQAAAEADWVLLTGGLGPTRDDLTRQALADALGVALAPHAPSLAHIEQFFRDRGRTMSPSNRVQALLPDGAEALDNPCGTAPGMHAVLERAAIFAFPGVPHEMRAMFDRHVAPRLAGSTGRVLLTRTLHTFGLGEAQVGERLSDLMRRERNPTVGTTVARGIVSVRLRGDFPTRAEAETALRQTEAEARARLGEAVFGADDDTLPAVVGGLLAARGRTLATAESCTGGLVGALLTETPGASAYYRGGWIVYANALKHSQLDVPESVLSRAGAVSEPTARALAEAALRRAETDYALALTGLAGPAAGTADKPVGTVWIALGARRADGAADIQAACHHLPGNRTLVRERAAYTALDWLRRTLL